MVFLGLINSGFHNLDRWDVSFTVFQITDDNLPRIYKTYLSMKAKLSRSCVIVIWEALRASIPDLACSTYA